MKRALYFSTYFNPIQDNRHYVMLYYALETLSAFHPFDFDVVVFCATPGKNDIAEYNHKGLYNIVRDFPWVKFYNSDYFERFGYEQDAHFMHKWYHLKSVFDLGYEQVFYSDADVIFMKNPTFLFDVYDSETCLYMPKVSDKHAFKLIEDVYRYSADDRYGRSSSNWILHKKVFDTLPETYYDEVCDIRRQYVRDAEALFGEDAIKTTPFSEQYAGTLLFLKYSRILDWKDGSHFAWGEEGDLWDTDFTVDGVKTVKKDIVMWHYTGGKAPIACRKDLLTDHMIEERKKIHDWLVWYKTGLIYTKEESSVRDSDSKALLSVDNDALRTYKENRAKR